MVKSFNKVTFGDVVISVNRNIRCSEDESIDRVVGLEHIETDKIHITSWDSRETNTSFTKLFIPGQTLFGKRRTYLRKTAYAEFSGICSGDILVFESKNRNALLPELLPFICQSDSFYSHSLQTSAGSLSPRTSWNALKKYQFYLPDIEAQKRASNILWSIDEASISWNDVLKNLSIAQKSLFSNASFHYDSLSLKPLKELTLFGPQYGLNVPASKLTEGGFRYVRITDITDQGELIHDNEAGISSTSVDASKYLLHPGDLLFARTGSIGKTFIYLDSYPPCVFAGYLIRFKVNPELILPEYLFLFTQSEDFLVWVKKTVRIGVQPNINGKEFMELPVPVPSIDVQNDIVSKAAEIKALEQACKNHLQLLTTLQKKLINSLVEGTSVLRD